MGPLVQLGLSFIHKHLLDAYQLPDKYCAEDMGMSKTWSLCPGTLPSSWKDTRVSGAAETAAMLEKCTWVF